MNDPKREYCNCGYSFVPSTFMKVLMIVCGDYQMRCPRCGTVMVLHMSYFVYVKERKQTRNEMIWRKG